MIKMTIRLVKTSFALIVFLISVSNQTQAATIHVPADFPKIQQAINAAQNGDTVLVAPGIYTEKIRFQGKAITLTSEAGPQQTIIDGQGGFFSMVAFVSGETRSTVLSGFTIQGGGYHFSSFNDEGGIYIDSSSPTIIGNIIQHNHSRVSGGGIGIVGACSPLIQGNIISHNLNDAIDSNRGGGGIGVYRESSPIIIDNVISDNEGASRGGGVSFYLVGNIVLRNNTIIRNKSQDGGGVYLANCISALIVQNLIADNNYDFSDFGPGTGIFIRSDGNRTPGIVVLNNTIANHRAYRSGIVMINPRVTYRIINNIVVAWPGRVGIASLGSVGVVVPEMFQSNNVFSSQGMAYGDNCPDQTGINGNISVDPKFMNAENGDYHLQQDSPSIDKGDNSALNLPVTDFENNVRIFDGDRNGSAIVDMGVYEYGSSPFNLCVQDESTKDILRINSITGAYHLTRCSDGVTIGGTGTLTRRGCNISFQDTRSDRRIMASIDTCTNRASASIQIFAQGSPLSFSDRNITNNTCNCPSSN